MPRRQPQPDPIQTAISTWLTPLGPPTDNEPTAWRKCLCDNAPKRFTIYEPMALLPAGSFANAPWTAELQRRNAATTNLLWELILGELSKTGQSALRLTHLAANEGIPLQSRDGTGENTLRSPSGLRILYGDFGAGAPSRIPPSEEDFGKAFWVSAKQNGISQTWAPRWTMFSRGNVKEKARLLQFPAASGRRRDGDQSQDAWAVDLYAGIGYFAFCYARLGFRVLCWELNPWSVEALRRGARLNNWSVEVVEGDRLKKPVAEIVKSTAAIVVFAESNENARWRAEGMKREGRWLRDVRHVNCGLLPTSRMTWDVSLFLTRSTTMGGRAAWLHLHENVGDAEIDARKQEIQTLLGENQDEKRLTRAITVERVEKVKSYAPGVWHCVFDVHIAVKS
ncbi:tRNA wybutosine-synthesizing protein [Metarhizium album ARSEF 1941]|uniref:tRNA wybutosine-synthesizing protein 2 n=1 Tax=Metarhizium album (strain ARSEF 1941) TaxID=1081103 RepID=A0A0B2WQG1_METAS|nr:tRNA wybutosine-synthesizing protein [Metarhizium album ARSEF 1941]KHN98276.1 tRNA wybutosine-synthesizing protein [Metarhizium album ARSEF 1941]